MRLSGGLEPKSSTLPGLFRAGLPPPLIGFALTTSPGTTLSDVYNEDLAL